LTHAFVEDLRLSAASWGTSSLLMAAATYALAGVWDAQRLMHLAIWLLLGLVVLPLAFAFALATCGLVLLAVLGLLALPARLLGRPTGLSGIALGLGSLALGIVPDYCRALRAVRQPWLWGAVLGFVAGVTLRFAIVGLAPA